MQQYQAMEILKNLVDKKYHRLIISSRPDLSHLLQNMNSLSSPIKPESAPHSNENNENDDNESNKILNRPLAEESELKNVHTIFASIPEIKYHELVEATGNWSEKNILGKGGFATVFVGSWRNTLYAIKRVELNQGKLVSDSSAKKTHTLSMEIRRPCYNRIKPKRSDAGKNLGVPFQ